MNYHDIPLAIFLLCPYESYFGLHPRSCIFLNNLSMTCVYNGGFSIYLTGSKNCFMINVLRRRDAHLSSFSSDMLDDLRSGWGFMVTWCGLDPATWRFGEGKGHRSEKDWDFKAMLAIEWIHRMDSTSSKSGKLGWEHQLFSRCTSRRSPSTAAWCRSDWSWGFQRRSRFHQQISSPEELKNGIFMI